MGSGPPARCRLVYVHTRQSAPVPCLTVPTCHVQLVKSSGLRSHFARAGRVHKLSPGIYLFISRPASSGARTPPPDTPPHPPEATAARQQPPQRVLELRAMLPACALAGAPRSARNEQRRLAEIQTAHKPHRVSHLLRKRYSNARWVGGGPAGVETLEERTSSRQPRSCAVTASPARAMRSLRRRFRVLALPRAGARQTHVGAFSPHGINQDACLAVCAAVRGACVR